MLRLLMLVQSRPRWVSMRAEAGHEIMCTVSNIFKQPSDVKLISSAQVHALFTVYVLSITTKSKRLRITKEYRPCMLLLLTQKRLEENAF